MSDAMDKQNDLIKKYQEALDIAAEHYANEGCKQAILKEWKEAAGIE